MSTSQNPTKRSADAPVFLMNEKSVRIDNALTTFKELQNRILKDTDKMKSEIQSSVEHLITLMRTREQQLLRQVDVLSRNESLSIQTHIARLHYAQGLFDMYLRCLEKSGESPVPAVINKTLLTANEIIRDTDKMSKLYNDTSKLMKFTADLDSVIEPILNFGCVNSTSSIVRFPESEGSKCLPSRLEEYEDVDHHMLYKSLSELKTKDPFTAKLNIMNGFQNECEWLRKSVDEPLKEDQSKSASKLENELKMEVDAAVNFDSMQIWLREVKNDAMETEGDAVTINHLSWPDDASSKSSSDESIVMISLPGSELPADQWKENCLPKFSKLHSEVMKDFQRRCCNAQDMEDDPMFSCSQFGPKSKTMWLRKDSSSEDIGKVAIPLVKDVCCANEPCDTLNDCLCDRNCALTQKHTSPGGNSAKTFQLIDPMLNILYSKNTWIREKGGEVNNSTTQMLDFLSEFRQGGDLKNWLNSESFLNSVQTKLASFSVKDREAGKASVDNCLKSEWLRKNELNEKIKHDSCPIARMFQRYFEPTDMNMWLASGKVI